MGFGGGVEEVEGLWLGGGVGEGVRKGGGGVHTFDVKYSNNNYEHIDKRIISSPFTLNIFHIFQYDPLINIKADCTLSASEILILRSPQTPLCTPCIPPHSKMSVSM